jgi:aspartate ammonia-lyase
VLEKDLLTRDELNELLDPENMIQPRNFGKKN